MHLDARQAADIAARIAALESHTGVQAITAIVTRTDRYPETRWKAFALGVSLAALAVALHDLLRPGWMTPLASLGDLLLVLGTGITSALVANFIPACGRRFVRDNRAEAAVRQYAEGLFLERELFATPGRTAVLVLLGRFERIVVVHADTGFAGRITAAEWASVVQAMQGPLRAGFQAKAILAGLDTLEGLLVERGFTARGAVTNTLPDRPIEERGA